MIYFYNHFSYLINWLSLFLYIIFLFLNSDHLFFYNFEFSKYFCKLNFTFQVKDANEITKTFERFWLLTTLKKSISPHYSSLQLHIYNYFISQRQWPIQHTINLNWYFKIGKGKIISTKNNSRMLPYSYAVIAQLNQ